MSTSSSLTSDADPSPAHCAQRSGLIAPEGGDTIGTIPAPTKISSAGTRCAVCADLQPEVALGLTQTGRDDIWYYMKNPWDAKKIPVPSWASDKREDLAAWELHTSTNKIKTAAEGGCPLCEMLLGELREYSIAPTSRDSRDEPAVIIFCPGNVLRLRVGATQNNENSGAQPTEIEFYTDTEDGMPGRKIGSNMSEHSPRQKSYPSKARKAKKVPVDSDSEDCWSQIVSWAEECGRDHFLCGSQTGFIAMPITSSRMLPRRVLYVGNAKDYSDIRLFESDFCDGVYLALSHAWGNHLTIKTTTTNLDQWKKNIPWKELSKTFQDAICITRKIGVCYLWVDALCIIQDDKNDWEAEAANMAKIYRDALIVISATLSADGSGGCFSNRQTSREVGVLQDDDGTETKVFARLKLPHEPFGQTHQVSIHPHRDEDESLGQDSIAKRERDIGEHPVLQRAWCYQERLLSRRTLHYTKRELIWECVQTTSCECGMLPRSSDDVNSIRRQMNTVRIDYANPTMSLLMGMDSGPPYWLPEDWGKIIQQYSHKRLSYATDTLAALAGLASTLHRGEGIYLGKYLVGLWERGIDTYLGWMPFSKEVVRPRDRAQCSFPSWSWASIDTPFYWPSWGSKKRTMVAFVVTGNDVKPTYEGPEVTSMIRTSTGYSFPISTPKFSYSKWTDGSLFINARVFEATLTGMDDSRPVHAAFLERDGIRCSFVVDRRPQCLGLVGHAVHVMRLTQVAPLQDNEDADDNVDNRAPAYSLAFVLLKVSGKERTYQRIGMLKGVPEEWPPQDGDPFHDFELV